MTIDSADLNETESYVPPRTWTWVAENGGPWGSINRPTSGSTHEKNLPIGKWPFQLYSMGTPNGVKVTIMLEELLALGHSGAEYDAWMIRISEGDQFSTGFVAINPNSKIPAMLDRSVDPPLRIFESGSILIYLAEKFGEFLSTEPRQRTETLNWLMWLTGAAPYLGGGFGHFYMYAPSKLRYPIDRFAMEVKRQLHLLDARLRESAYIAGDSYTIADIAIWPWYSVIMRNAYDAGEFLATHEYAHVERWVQLIAERPAVKRGRVVNSCSGDFDTRLHERHDSSDFEGIK